MDNSLADASENSLEAMYEICLLITAASSFISQPRIDNQGHIFDSIKTGIYYLNNWDVPTDQLQRFTIRIFSDGLGLADHERLFHEFAEQMLAMDDQEFENYIVRCASLITEKPFRFLTMHTAILACEPEGLDYPEIVRIERFFKNWWGYEDKASIDGVWDEIASFSEELEFRMSEANKNEAI